MSRVGNKPIPLPAGVEVTLSEGTVCVKGSHGELSLQCHPSMSVEHDQEARELRVVRPDDQRHHRALHGLTRSLINNMVVGVTEQFQRQLDIQGVGYQALLDDNVLNLNVGFSNTVKLTVPNGIICDVPGPTQIVVRGCDKQAVGQFAADIRQVRPPEPYKGKGIRYRGEFVRRKQGKAFVGAGD